MKLSHATFVLGCTALLTVGARWAPAASVVVEAGQTHTLNEDLILNGDDTLEIRGTPDKPCKLVGNRHRIRTGPKWSGTLRITHCTIQNLGGTPKHGDNGLVAGPGAPAFELKAAGKATITIEHCTFDASAAIDVQNDDGSVTVFRHNTVLDSTVVAISKDNRQLRPRLHGAGKLERTETVPGQLHPARQGHLPGAQLAGRRRPRRGQQPSSSACASAWRPRATAPKSAATTST